MVAQRCLMVTPSCTWTVCGTVRFREGSRTLSLVLFIARRLRVGFARTSRETYRRPVYSPMEAAESAALLVSGAVKMRVSTCVASWKSLRNRTTTCRCCRTPQAYSQIPTRRVCDKLESQPYLKRVFHPIPFLHRGHA